MSSMGVGRETSGIPLALYCDLKNVYVIDRDTDLRGRVGGEVPQDCVWASCEKLGIRIVLDHSLALGGWRGNTGLSGSVCGGKRNWL